MVSIEEYPFIFMNKPASLQVLASAEMALTIWRRELANTSFDDAEERLCSEKKPRCKEVLDVPVPRSIQAQIDKKIVSIGVELEEWIDFHSNWDFFDGNSTEAFRAFVNCSKHIIVDFSGSIDYKATAINIVNSGKFNDVVNYKISCTFCLEDQVKRFWPTVATDPPIDENSPQDQCILSYWNGLMKLGNSITGTDDELVKLRMMEAEANTKTVPLNRGDETAFEYFCKMLPDDVRISKIISWLKRGDCDQAVTRILSTLDRIQAEKVFEQEASSIFRILVLNDNSFQFAHQLWTLMGHLVLEDESNFCDVVFELWKMAFDPDCDYLNYTRCDRINDFLLEIWSNASDELKAHVSDAFWRDELIFSSGYSDLPRFDDDFDDDTVFCRINFASYYGHDMTFTLEMMSKLSDDVDKEQLWDNIWPLLALRSKPLYLEKFMRMYLSNDDEIELFKNDLADFEDLFESLVEEGFYSDLKDYLLFCSKDAEQFQQLGEKVLEWNLHFILLHDDDKFAKFEWFVSEVFVNKLELEEFKRQMISSAKCVKNLLAARQADKIRSKDFNRIIRRFVNDEEELQQMKRKLFERCCTYPVDFEWSSHPKFNADQWQEFLVWCTADLEEIATFKRSLNVDVIFLERLKNYEYLYGEYCVEVLDFLDGFLKWYFGNEEDAKIFKLDKVKNYKQIDILRVEMKRKFIYTYDEMYGLLKWLFDGNVKNVVEFCKICNCSLRKRPYIN